MDFVFACHVTVAAVCVYHFEHTHNYETIQLFYTYPFIRFLYYFYC